MVLYYRLVPHNGGLVVATKERAEHIARIYRALYSAKTWADFRSLMPKAEYSEVMKVRDDWEDPRPKSSDPFDAEQVPGFSDGDYPPWLQQEMPDLIEESILERFGTKKNTFVNGSFWHIPAE